MKTFFLRFFFVYFLLSCAPWQWFEFIPGLDFMATAFNSLFVPIVTFFNDTLFHIKETLNQNGGGSGDTSFAWAQFYTIIILSLVGAVIWTFINRKKKSTKNLNWVLINLLRYHLIVVALLYGTIKLFAQQMPEPGLSMLATPIGDFLPMRFCWMFFGYSAPYQVFSGVIEIIIAILLLYRRTIPLGIFMGFGVFLNVFVLNLSFDIPVKLFSMQLVICCLYLLWVDMQRYLDFFLLNKPTASFNAYDWVVTKKYMRIGRIAFKFIIVLLFGVFSLFECWSWESEQAKKTKEQKPIEVGIYSVKTFQKNNVAQTISIDDESLWKDFVFEKDGLGSINTNDTLLSQKYRRGYFIYSVKPKKETIVFSSLGNNGKTLFELKYKMTKDKTLQLWGKVKSDSVFFELQKSNKQFQLMEKQFHWISEANR